MRSNPSSLALDAPQNLLIHLSVRLDIFYRCSVRNHIGTMQSKKAREVIIWIVVIGMVLGLLFSVLAVLA